MADAISSTSTIRWDTIEAELDNFGCAILKGILSKAQCEGIAGGYPDDNQFRKRIVMARHGFGRGEYKYFSYPLPDVIGDLRQSLYPPLAGIANRWNELMGIDVRYPDKHQAFIERCHAAGRIVRRPCCWNMARGITIACIRISTASTCFRCR